MHKSDSLCKNPYLFKSEGLFTNYVSHLCRGLDPTYTFVSKCRQMAYSHMAYPTPLFKRLYRLVSVSKETVSTLHTLVPRQTSSCR